MLKTKAATVSIRFLSIPQNTLKSHSTPTRRKLQIACIFVLAGCMSYVAGCKRFQQEKHDTVYVAARQVYLHDRIAAVSERVALVTNGQKLEVLDHNRRFYKVKTEKNEIGWIEERTVIDSNTYQGFMKLAEDHKDDPKATTATLRDDLYMHIAPGRDSDHLYLLPGNAKVDLLARASAPRVTGPRTSRPAPAKPASQAKAPATKSSTPGTARSNSSATDQPEPPPPPPMEDWWLGRDNQGHIGWLLSSRLDVDVPMEVAQYGENQRFIGCWVLTKVNDPGTDTPADHQVPIYLTVTAPIKSGMPFDFDQVRVFTWSMRRHRYETGFRLHPIRGFLPVRVGTQQTPKGPVPTFSFQIAGSESVAADPATGIMRPASTRTITYQLIDTQVKRVGPDLAPIPITRDPDSKPKAAQKAAKKKRR
jgi:hypothetical protein